MLYEVITARLADAELRDRARARRGRRNSRAARGARGHRGRITVHEPAHGAPLHHGHGVPADRVRVLARGEGIHPLSTLIQQPNIGRIWVEL